MGRVTSKCVLVWYGQTDERALLQGMHYMTKGDQDAVEKSKRD